MSHLEVRHYINRLITGDKGGWPMDWFAGKVPGQVFDRALSIGCGAGALERDLLRRGLCRRIDAFDGSLGSIAVARHLAREEGFGDRVRYFLSDFNRPAFPRVTYDAVFFHQSLHHVEKLERLLTQVMFAIRDGGVVYLDEFVGPSRTYWTERTTAWYSAIYDLLPTESRQLGTFAMPVQYDDTSEAIRSSEILPTLSIGFEITHYRGYGGNLLAMMWPDLNIAKTSDDLVRRLISSEQRLLDSGAASFHALVIATPKRGLARQWARLRYYVEPKARRILRTIFPRRKPRLQGMWERGWQRGDQ